MQTRTYGDLFKLIRSLAGVGSFATSELDDIANLINRRYSEAFNTSPIWPRYIVTSEERDIASLVLSGLTAGSSSNDKSGVSNGNYALFGVVSSGTGAVIGTKVYYNVATGTESVDGISGGTILFKRASTSRWELQDGTDINVLADGTISVEAGGGATLLAENLNGRPSVLSFLAV